MLDPHFERLSQEFKRTLDRHAKGLPQHFYATVTSLNPLYVTRDGDSTAQPAGYCQAYATGQAVGDRVYCVSIRHEVTVTDKIAAPMTPSP